MRNTRVESALEGLKLTTIRKFSKVPAKAGDDPTSYWAERVCQKTGHPEDYQAALKAVETHLDGLLKKRGMSANSSTYPPEVAPPNRPRGLGPEHSCAAPTSCEDAPEWWEDHCHAYALLIQFKSGESETRNRAYSQLSAYYHPVVRGVLRKFRTQIEPSEIASFSVGALHSCIDAYDTARKVPLQAYLRAQLARRIVDRLRSEGKFTRSEGALSLALQEFFPDYVVGDPISQADMLVLAKRFNTTISSIEGTLTAYARKVRTLHVEFSADGDSDSFLQVPSAGSETAAHAEEAMIRTHDARVGFELLAGSFSGEDRSLLLAWFSSEPGMPNPILDDFLESSGLTRSEASQRVTALLQEVKARALNFTGEGSLARSSARSEFARSVTAGVEAYELLGLQTA